VTHGAGSPGVLRLALLLWAALLVAACGQSPATSTPGAPSESIPPTGSGAPAALVSPVVGVPIDIEAEGLSRVTAFTIRTDAGVEQRFLIGTLENGAAFPPGHLAEHLAGSSPIRVFFRAEGGDLVAYRLEDALAVTAAP
jgi:hypothetical protein